MPSEATHSIVKSPKKLLAVYGNVKPVPINLPSSYQSALVKVTSAVSVVAVNTAELDKKTLLVADWANVKSNPPPVEGAGTVYIVSYCSRTAKWK